MRKVICLCLCVAGAAIVTGCAAPATDGELTTFSTPISVEERDSVWEASQDVLRRHRFTMDRVDRRAGVITTHPVTSEHFFEFWRKDVVTPYDAWEATLRTVRRRAEVQFAQQDGAGDTVLTVTVHREFFASPERQYNNSIAAMRMFGDALPAEQTGERLTPSDNYWIDDGRDLAMERHLLDQIVASAGG